STEGYCIGQETGGCPWRPPQPGGTLPSASGIWRGGLPMSSLLGQYSLLDLFTRREVLRIGGLTALGLGTADLARLHALSAPRTPRSCVCFCLFGGPSQIALGDMKPAAPAEIRGDFRPAATRVPGIRICEHLPRLAQVMDRVCLVRSMTHRMNVHGPACS